MVAGLQQKAQALAAEVAERRRTEERLRAALPDRTLLLESERAARKQAETAFRARDEFLAVAAHELRTPLTSVLWHAQMALRRAERSGGLPLEATADTVGAIVTKSRRVTRLIETLLDVTRLETGRLTLSPQHVDLVALVQEAATAARALSDRHTIAVHAPTALHATVDPLRVEQVLINLLDNAIKYSPEGGPIDVVLVQVDAAPRGPTAELSVRDRGLGIPPDNRDHVFERFHQAHAATHRSGLGLGLYVCRQIVQLHHGDIQAEFPPPTAAPALSSVCLSVGSTSSPFGRQR